MGKRAFENIISTPPGPLPWEFRCKNGNVINPHEAQEWFVSEIQHGASNHAMNRFFGVGEMAISIYLENSNTIPSHVGEKIAWLIDNGFKIRRKTVQDTRNQYVARKVYLEKLFAETSKIKRNRRAETYKRKLERESDSWKHDAQKTSGTLRDIMEGAWKDRHAANEWD